MTTPHPWHGTGAPDDPDELDQWLNENFPSGNASGSTQVGSGTPDVGSGTPDVGSGTPDVGRRKS